MTKATNAAERPVVAMEAATVEELEAEIEKLDAAQRGANKVLGDARPAAAEGYAEAQKTVARLDQESAARKTRRAELVKRRDEIKAEAARKREAEEAARAAAHPVLVDRLVADRYAEAEELAALGAQFAAALCDFVANGVKLGAAVGTPESMRLEDRARIVDRLRAGFANTFFVQPEPDGSFTPQSLRFFTTGGEQDVRAKRGILALEQEALDAIAREIGFASEAAAQAVQARLHARGEATVIGRLAGGRYVLLPPSARWGRAAAGGSR